MKAEVLLVDDERTFRVVAEEALSAQGYRVRTAPNLTRARAELAREAPDVVILDRRLPDGDGLTLLETLTGGPLSIVVTAYGDIDSAVQALRSGAEDYLTKPIQIADLIVKLDKALEGRRLRDRLALERSHPARPPLIAGSSLADRRMREQLNRVAASRLTPVLFVGPSGAGKQCAAELLHAMTHARGDTAPFVEVNCAALPADLVESELFGHEKGAFTGASAVRRGLAEMADGGTLFLDEVAELPERSQAKLLKFLDTMRFRRVGGDREIEVELRVVAATNQDVHELVQRGALRADLYHRLGVFTVTIPALFERKEDIPGLVAAYTQFFAGRVNKRISGLSTTARDKLLSYGFPGNVRELRNVIERAVILARGPEIDADDVVLGDAAAARRADAFFAVDLDGGRPPPLEAVERAYVRRVVDFVGGRHGLAADALGISHPTLLRKLRDRGDDGDGT